MSRARVFSLLAAALAFVLAGCATSTADASRTAPTPAASPTCAVAAQPGADPPAGCVAFDPGEKAASNELYRERMPQPTAGREAGEALIAPVTAALSALGSSGAPLTDETVRAALTAAGLPAAHLQTDAGSSGVSFGAAVPGGGCVFGGVTPDAVTVEVGGFIMDGGCLAMVGH